MILEPWEFALLGLAAWRTFQLVAFDEILDGPRQKILRAGGEDYRAELDLFLTCPYCAGFWISGLWLTAWVIATGALFDDVSGGEWVLTLASWFALSAVVVGAHKVLALDEDR